jgi:hypothetical protein
MKDLAPMFKLHDREKRQQEDRKECQDGLQRSGENPDALSLLFPPVLLQDLQQLLVDLSAEEFPD